MNNNDEIYLNDVIMEEEIFQNFGIQPNLQTKKSVNVDERKKINKRKFEKFTFSKEKVE